MDKRQAVLALIERLQERVGRAVRWLLFAVALSGFVVALLRYGVGIGAVWLQEAQLWLHASLVLLAAGWTLQQDGHVRVDIWYRTAPPHRRALADLLGALLLLVPATLTLFWLSLPYALESWRRLEGSREAGGLPALFLLKSVIPMAFLLLAAAGLAQAIRAWGALRRRETGQEPSP
jgi:TRAP-type mannitol/chloroaromatic compound transport system permease small subunit